MNPSPESPEEKTPPAETSAAKTPVRRRWFACRRRYWCLCGLTLILAAVVAAVFMVESYPYWMVRQALTFSGAPVLIESARWTRSEALRLEGISVGDPEHPFLRIDHINARWTWSSLLFRRELSEVDIVGGTISTGELDDYLAKNRGASHNIFLQKVGKLRITGSVVMLDELGPNIPAIPIPIGAKTPFVFNNLFFGAGLDSPDLPDEQQAVIDDVEINSPWDAISPVFSFDRITITYTVKGLLDGHIKKVDMSHPVIYVGQDLFWFTDQFGKKSDAAAPNNGKGWHIDTLTVEQGQMAVTVFGRPSVTLPFYFSSNATDINLDELDKMTVKNQITIYKQNLNYPEYKVNVDDLEGKIEFSLPLTDKHADNLVQTIHIKEISWDDIAMTDAWASVTFDQQGIFGSVGGKSYEGYVKGDFSIFFKGGFPWEANLYATTVNIGPIAQKMISKYVDLTGGLNGTLNVKGLSTVIQHCWGNLKLLKPGVLNLEFIPDLIKRISPDWAAWKRDAAKIGLEAFQTYHYRNGGLKFDYTAPSAFLSLNLDGLEGKRNFVVNWHITPTAEVAKASAGE